MSGHGFQRLWEEQGDIQLRAVAALLRNGLLDDASPLGRCPDVYSSIQAYVDTLLPLVGAEAVESLRSLVDGGIGFAIPWIATASNAEDAGESLVRTCLTVRRVDHDTWEAELRTSLGAATQRRTAMPAARAIICLRPEASARGAGAAAGDFAIGLVTRVTSDRGVTFIEALFHRDAGAALGLPAAVSGSGAGIKRPRPDASAPPTGRFCCWTGPNAVSALREAGALLGLHTYDAALVAGILNAGGGGSGGPPVAAAPTALPTASRGLMRGLSPEERRFYLPSPAYRAHFLDARFNPSQRAAIVGAVTRGGITLIQGPPGTGKSTTIIGLLNTLHISAYNYYNAVLMGRAGSPRLATVGSAPSLPSAPAQSSVVLPKVVAATILLPRAASTLPTPSAPPPPMQSLQSLLRSAASTDGVGSSGTPVNAEARPPEPGTVHGVLRWLLYSDASTEACLARVREAVQLRPRLLVTAPSNAAVDSLVCTLARDGMRGNSLVAPPPQQLGPAVGGSSDMESNRPEKQQHLERYRPPIARVGDGASAAAVATRVCVEPEVDTLLRMPPADVDAWGATLNAERASLTAEVDRVRARFKADLPAVTARDAASAGEPSVPGSAQSRASTRLFLSASATLLHIVNAFERNRTKLVRHRWLEVVRDCSADRSDRNLDADVRRELRTSLLEDAEIVLTTTSSAAAAAIEAFVQATGHVFEIVVVDEAAQAVEPSTLIPLRYGCVQAVLVGDPAQLPPTVMCRAAAHRGYDRSLFARLADGGYPTHLLDTQYRMHPALSAFPSARFYGGRIRDAPSVCGAARESALLAEPCFRPLLFFDLINAQQGMSSEAVSARAGVDDMRRHAGASATEVAVSLPVPVPPGRPAQRSFSNRDEAAFVVALLRALNAWRGRDAGGQKIRFSGSVGVISFYRGQVDLLQRLVASTFPAKAPPTIDAAASKASEPSVEKLQPLHFTLDINTVDGYQGSERDIIIVSCVRTLPADNSSGQGTADAAPMPLPNSFAADAGSSSLPRGPAEAPALSVLPVSEFTRATTDRESSEAVVSSAIGFVNDPRRMNVALTRGKFACWVVGNARALRTSLHWRAFVDHCRGATGGRCAAVPVTDPVNFVFSKLSDGCFDDSHAVAAGVSASGVAASNT